MDRLHNTIVIAGLIMTAILVNGTLFVSLQDLIRTWSDADWIDRILGINIVIIIIYMIISVIYAIVHLV